MKIIYNFTTKFTTNQSEKRMNSANTKSFNLFPTVIYIILVFIMIICIGAIIALQSITMIRWWIPLVGAAVLSFASGTTLWRIWRKLTTSDRFLPNFILHSVFFTFFLTTLFFSLNAIFTSENTRKEDAFVESKYREKHHRSRRVGRNRYVTGPAYYEYYITVKLKTGETRNIELPWETYQGIKNESDITLSFKKGLFGADVLITDDIPEDNPVVIEPKHRRRCKFFGTSGKKH